MQLTEKGRTPEMFDTIAKRYDLLNRVISLGFDRAWRRAMLRVLPHQRGLAVLDVATGTGDVLRELAADPRVQSVEGIDPSPQMLAIAQKKLRTFSGQKDLSVTLGTVERLPYQDAAFDVVTIAFGIRNVPQPLTALKEMRRVLKPGGSLIVLEASRPERGLRRLGHTLYLRLFLPNVGGFLSGNRKAYEYLDKSIEAFPSGKTFCDLLRVAGFREPYVQPMMFGSISLYRAYR